MKARTPTGDNLRLAGQPLWGRLQTHPIPEPLTLDLHHSFELGIVLRGQVERRHEDCVITLNAGEVWLNAAWEPHAWRTTRPNTAEVAFHFVPDFLRNETVAGVSWLAPFAVPPSARPKVTTPEIRELAVSTAYEVLREAERRRNAWLDASRLALLRLLLALTRDWKPPLISRRRSYARADDLPRMLPAISLVQSNPTRHITREEAAAACALSVSHFAWLFQRTMGLSFGAFCVRARLAAAAQRLLEGKLSVEAIASECGFSHGSHLHRLFLKYYASSPGHYRQSGRAAPVPHLAERR